MVLDDGLPTATSRDQAELERRVLQIYAKDYADGGEGARSRGSRCLVPPTCCRRCRRRAPQCRCFPPPVEWSHGTLSLLQGLTRKIRVWC